MENLRNKRKERKKYGYKYHNKCYTQHFILNGILPSLQPPGFLSTLLGPQTHRFTQDRT